MTRRRVHGVVLPLGIFALSRLVDALLILVVARRQVPASQLPPPVPVPVAVDPPTYLHVITNWDGQWYEKIVEHGYPGSLPVVHGVVQQNAWGFHPLYPSLVRLFVTMGLGFGVAASLVSLAAGATAMCVLFALLRERTSDFTASLAVLALCCAPAAPVFQAAYTESLALLLLCVALLCLERRRYGWLLLVGFLLALARPIAPPLALVCAAEWVRRWRGREVHPFSRREAWQLGGVAVGMLASAAVWPLVAGIAVGDLSAYTRTQHAWRAAVSSRPDTWVSSLVHGAPFLRGCFVVLVVGGGVLLALRNRHWTFGTRVWTAVYPAFVLAVTPVTFSVFRYALLGGPAWWPLARFDGKDVSRTWRVSLVAVVVVGGLLTQILWLDWYFVLTPESRGIP